MNQSITFAYRARDAAGAVVTGAIEARSEAEAVRALQREGKTVTDVRIGSTPVDADAILTRQAGSRVRREEVIGFCNQLAVMLETGVPLAEALSAYLAQSRGGPLHRIVSDVSEKVHAGLSLSAALAGHPRVFPTLVISLIRASEATGMMGPMLARVSEYLAKERRTQKQIKGALAYPMAMMSVAVIVTGFLVVWVLPRFAKIYESRAAALPTPTRVLLDSSGFIIGNWLAIAIAGAALVAGILFARSTPRGRIALDTIKTRTPLLGVMFTNFYLTRSMRTLGTLLASGVSLMDAVAIVRGVTRNSLWDRLWTDFERSIASGKTVAEVAVASPLLPPSVAQMIAAGERSGRLPEVMTRVAEAAESDLDDSVKNLTQFIEPLMIMFMGVTVGGIAMALLLPIFSIATVVDK